MIKSIVCTDGTFYKVGIDLGTLLELFEKERFVTAIVFYPDENLPTKNSDNGISITECTNKIIVYVNNKQYIHIPYHAVARWTEE